MKRFLLSLLLVMVSLEQSSTRVCAGSDAPSSSWHVGPHDIRVHGGLFLAQSLFAVMAIVSSTKCEKECTSIQRSRFLSEGCRESASQASKKAWLYADQEPCSIPPFIEIMSDIQRECAAANKKADKTRRRLLDRRMVPYVIATVAFPLNFIASSVGVSLSYFDTESAYRVEPVGDLSEAFAEAYNYTEAMPDTFKPLDHAKKQYDKQISLAATQQVNFFWSNIASTFAAAAAVINLSSLYLLISEIKTGCRSNTVAK